ncbi:hypothetical protein [Paenibacillus sp. UASWS1643]|uniref:hypothetical protein n=1 Tax=Paenibacillus sp. UASWS1643 TaxID=2580422 RepID=UPI00123A3232|nr:hypothetical protein [Paenibacillus sp. UASWS1643]KAA8746141.1 hypothetical protein FE296_30510 [Paenibacillus sp. UASWS1643]
MTPTIHCGSFEAERYWRDPNLAVLPSLSDRQAMAVTEAMDELLFVFCNDGDILLTRNVMDSAQLDYIRSIGFDIGTNRKPWLENVEQITECQQLNVFELFNACTSKKLLLQTFPERSKIEAFAVLPGVVEIIQRCRLASRVPEQSIVQKINAKSYSLAMRDKLDIRNVGVIVEGIPRLIEEGSRMLRAGSILLKDEYGVSGKGNLSIDSTKSLLRIAKYLETQVAKGKTVRFILEPLLDRKTDFSCQFRISEEGKVTILSIQQLQNNGYAFGASFTMGAASVDRLLHLGYMDQMQQIGASLYQEGYFGDVCVDSMILQDETVEPIVEINARKSMSLIKHAVDCSMVANKLYSCLTQFTLLLPSDFNYEAFLDNLRNRQLLYDLGRMTGIVPLSSGTLLSSKRGSTSTSSKSTKGRLYVAVIYENEAQMDGLITGLKKSLSKAGLAIIA